MANVSDDTIPDLDEMDVTLPSLVHSSRSKESKKANTREEETDVKSTGPVVFYRFKYLL